jgi:hypothetical protein
VFGICRILAQSAEPGRGPENWRRPARLGHGSGKNGRDRHGDWKEDLDRMLWTMVSAYKVQCVSLRLRVFGDEGEIVRSSTRMSATGIGVRAWKGRRYDDIRGCSGLGFTERDAV